MTHLYVCDGPTCEQDEVTLGTGWITVEMKSERVGTAPPPAPSGGILYLTKHFCSRQCMSEYFDYGGDNDES